MREEDLSRRDFLERTAYAAGLAGMAGALPASTLLYEAADAEARRARLPSPRNVEIDHFVILMMENRSFDHYFGWVPGADASQRQSYRDPAGNQVPTRPARHLGASPLAGLWVQRSRPRLEVGPRPAAQRLHGARAAATTSSR